LSMYDRGLTRFTLRPQRSPDVVIVQVDDRTFHMVAANPALAHAYGNWPYYRTAWLHLAEHLAAEGARAVILDFTFDEPDSEASGDLKLGEGLAGGHLPVYAGVAASPAGTALPKVQPHNLFPAEIAAPVAAPEGADSGEFVETPEPKPPTGEQVALALAFPVVAEGGLRLPELHREADSHGQLRIAEPVPPTARLLTAFAGAGLVVPEVDADGKMRRTRFAYTDGTNTFVTLSVAAAADLLGARELRLSPGRLQLGERAIPINQARTAEIDYGGPLEARFQSFSFFDVLHDRNLQADGQPRYLPAGAFKDKVVLVGGFAIGLADRKATPFSSSVP